MCPEKYVRCCSLGKHGATEHHLSPDSSWAEISEGRMQELVSLPDTPFMILWFLSSGLAPVLLDVGYNMLSASLGTGVEVVDHIA